MPGGKGKIRPEDGKQFSSTYQPLPKWTQAKAEQLGADMIAWQKKEAVNIFFEEYLIMERDLYPEVIAYLSKKFSSFLKLTERAKKIQEIKLKKYGTADKLNAAMTKFVLTNDHGYSDRQRIEGEFQFNQLTDEHIDKIVTDLLIKLKQ
jgi:hypothetical protein